MKILHLVSCGVIRILGLLPLRLLTLIGYLIGLLYWQLGKRERRILLANIQFCYPGLSAAEQHRMAKNSLINTCICMLESTWMWAHKYPAIANKIRSIENEDLVKNSIAEGRGVVLVLAHFGNWEMYPAYVGYNYKNAVALVKDTGIEAFDHFLHTSRGRSGGLIAPCTREGLTQMYQLIAQGGVAAVGADQEPDPKHGCFAPLLWATSTKLRIDPRHPTKNGRQSRWQHLFTPTQGRGLCSKVL